MQKSTGVAEVSVDEVDLFPPRGELARGLCEVVLVSIDADEVSCGPNAFEEGTGMTAEANGGVKDRFS